MMRSVLRQVGRRMVGPTFYDALVQFGRWPLHTDVLAEARHSRCVFIEPHFDDVAFSCGGTLSALAQQGTALDLVTVCTADPDAGQPLSPLARRLHDEWGATHPYVQRRGEGDQVRRRLHINLVWLGVAEALYRRPHCTAMHELLDGSMPPAADPAFQTVITRLGSVLPARGRVTIFAPLGIGGHQDHRLVHAAVRTLALQRPDWSVWYYEDVPYAFGTQSVKDRLQTLEGYTRPATVDISATIGDRIRLSRCYTSQVQAIFGSADDMQAALEGYAAQVGTPRRPRERFWRVRDVGAQRARGWVEERGGCHPEAPVLLTKQ